MRQLAPFFGPDRERLQKWIGEPLCPENSRETTLSVSFSATEKNAQVPLGFGVIDRNSGWIACREA
jgi:hypothetical protein